MKSLVNYILEHNNELNLSDSVNYEHYTELLLYIKNSSIFSDRLQAICDKFRHDYNDNLNCEKLSNSKIFKKFIEDSITEYNKDYDNKIEINLGTKLHLMNEISSWMLPKIKLELEKLEDNNDVDE
jgi:hypothetical protein